MTDDATPEERHFPPTPIEGIPVGISNTQQFMQSHLAGIEKSTGHTASHSDMISAYSAWDEYKDKRFMKRVRNIGTAIGIIGAAVFGVYVMFGGNDVKPADVKKEVEKTAAAAEDSAEKERVQNRLTTEVNARNIQTIAELQVGAQKLQVASTKYVVDVVKAGPKGADEVEKPPELDEAEKEVHQRETAVAAGALLEKLPDPEE